MHSAQRIAGPSNATPVGLTANTRTSPVADIVRVTRVADLVRIYDPATQLCELARAPDPVIEAYWAAAAPRFGAGTRQLVELPSGLHPDELPDMPGRDRVIADIAWQLSLCADLMDCTQAALRIEVLRQAMCPRFHVDRTGMRLLCTWYGPGTEWLREDCADRAYLGSGANGKPDEESGLILDHDGIGAVGTASIALLKGDLWQGNEGRGAIHRSPRLGPGEGLRVLLALDPVWT